MKKDEAEERPKHPEALRPQPDAGTTQEMSRAEILEYLEKMKQEPPQSEPKPSRRPFGSSKSGKKD